MIFTQISSLPGLLKTSDHLIFDFDGTLVNTTPLHKIAFDKAFSPYGIAVDYMQIAGMSTEDAIQRVLTGASLSLTVREIEIIKLTKQRLVRELVSSSLSVDFDVIRFLESVRNTHSLSLATSGSRATVELALEKTSLNKYFSAKVFAESTRLSKPSPDPFLKVLEVTGKSRQNTLIFEDSDSGLQSAEASGIPCFHISIDLWPKINNYLSFSN